MLIKINKVKKNQDVLIIFRLKLLFDNLNLLILNIYFVC